MNGNTGFTHSVLTHVRTQPTNQQVNQPTTKQTIEQTPSPHTHAEGRRTSQPQTVMSLTNKQKGLRILLLLNQTCLFALSYSPKIQISSIPTK